ncbi:target of rapamycin complex 2 subunit MAPKAP1-like [Glandiceps talaboti]
MALIDDPAFIIAHIRHAYLTSDDSGMSEMVIVNEDNDYKSREKVTERGQGSEVNRTILDEYGYHDHDNYAESYDVESTFDIGIRRRSNTAARLEKLKQQRKNQPRTKHIQWKDRPIPYNEDDTSYFEKKEVQSKKQPPRKSALTEQLEKFPHQTNNPFNEYAKFDGTIHLNSTTINVKKIHIYLTMLLPQERCYPMTVFVIPSAKVQELIGLICFQYTNEGREPALKENVDGYSLHIAEDDGEVDTDFPALDNREVISKFGFQTLALVEFERPAEPDKRVILVKVNVPYGGFSLIQVDGLDTLMKDILEKTMKRRKGRVRIGGPDYILEKQSRPGVTVNLESTLDSQDTMEFCLVRENSMRNDVIQNTSEGEFDLRSASFLVGYQYKSYRVYMLHKFKTNTEVQLGISGDKVEIDPVSQQKSTKFWSRQKAVSYEVENIASCDIVDERHTGRSVFRLTYFVGNDFKHHDLETDTATANEIVTKINHILELCTSSIRREYTSMRGRKGSRRL